MSPQEKRVIDLRRKIFNEIMTTYSSKRMQSLMKRLQVVNRVPIKDRPSYLSPIRNALVKQPHSV